MKTTNPKPYFTFCKKSSVGRVYQLLHDKEAIALHESSLNLANVYSWVQRLSEIHHNVSPQHLMTQDRVDKFKEVLIILYHLVISSQTINFHRGTPDTIGEVVESLS